MSTRSFSQKREAERGAAVFIVVMVLALVTALGIFAVRSASLAEVAAGYDREAAQASLLAQYATSTTAAYLSAPAGSFNLDVMPSLKPTLDCLSSNNVPTRCIVLRYDQLNDPTFSGASATLFGPAGSPTLNADGLTAGDFLVELTDGTTDATPRPGGGYFQTVTVTVTAQVRPTGATCSTALNSNAGQQVVRALITK